MQCFQFLPILKHGQGSLWKLTFQLKFTSRLIYHYWLMHMIFFWREMYILLISRTSQAELKNRFDVNMALSVESADIRCA